VPVDVAPTGAQELSQIGQFPQNEMRLRASIEIAAICILAICIVAFAFPMVPVYVTHFVQTTETTTVTHTQAQTRTVNATIKTYTNQTKKEDVSYWPLDAQVNYNVDAHQYFDAVNISGWLQNPTVFDAHNVSITCGVILSICLENPYMQSGCRVEEEFQHSIPQIRAGEKVTYSFSQKLSHPYLYGPIGVYQVVLMQIEAEVPEPSYEIAVRTVTTETTLTTLSWIYGTETHITLQRYQAPVEQIFAANAYYVLGGIALAYVAVTLYRINRMYGRRRLSRKSKKRTRDR
jgi:hypothetical protein